jgi:imidazolonepropionase-like amidohydrolase
MSDVQGINFVADGPLDADARVELTNGRFVDVVKGCFFEPGTRLVIESGRILSISGQPAQPGDRRADFTMDLGGRTVLPGLFNAHCHVNMASPTMVPSLREFRAVKRAHERQVTKDLAECLAHGITNIRDAYSPDLRPLRSLKERISKGLLRGPRIVLSVSIGPPGGYQTQEVTFRGRLMGTLLGFPQVGYDQPHSGVVVFPVDADEQQVRDAVDRAVDERGAEAIKVGEQLENMRTLEPDSTIMSLEQLAAVADQARHRGVQSTMHHVSVESFRRAVEAGISSLAHAPFNAPLTHTDIEAFNASGTIIEPTCTVVYCCCWRVEGDPFFDDPEMVRLSEFREQTVGALMDEYWVPELRDCAIRGHDKINDGNYKAMGLMSMKNVLTYYSPALRHGSENITALFRAGATMGAGNDGGVPPCTPAMIQHEMKMLDFALNRDSVDAIFSGADAVRIATINSARSLALDDDFGSLEAGKVADLAIIDGDPLQDPTLVGTRVAALFMDGKLTINNCGLAAE